MSKKDIMRTLLFPEFVKNSCLIEEYFPLKDFKSDESDFLKKDAIKNLKIIYRKERND